MFLSYVSYMGTVFFATFFAYLAQKYARLNKEGRLVPNSFFYVISMLSLILVLGFRDISIGVDGYSYFNNYITANNMDILSYYEEHVTEPGYYLLYKISYFLGNFQWLFILTAGITIYFFYKAFSYEINKLSLPLVIFIFSTTQYFYYFGIMRMGIAVSIVAYAYRYIIENNKKKYILFVLIATMFHYSALFSLIMLILSKNKNGAYKKINLIKIAFGIPILFLGIKYLIFPFINIDRYENYTESTGIISTEFITTLPLIGLFIFYYNKYVKYNRNFHFYFLLLLVKVITEIFSPLIGIGRMVWYVNISICFLFPALLTLTKDKGKKVILLLTAIGYCVVYSYFSYFGDSFRGKTMLPYKTFLSNLLIGN